MRCYLYNKKRHFKKDFQEKGKTAMVNEMGYDSVESLAISSSNYNDAWVFHMTPFHEWFVDHKELNGGIIYMSNNHLCNVNGVGFASMIVQHLW